MSTQARALIIALLGPAVSVFGAIWVIVNVLVDSGRELTFRYVIFDPGHLIIAVGLLVSIVSIPLAFQVAEAEPEELELDLFEPDPAQQRAERPADIAGRAWEEAPE